MLKEQMEMFEEGGLKDDGGTVDPISGNDVPSGSTQEEVRDDIPAQLSEGEFVFPADVVRYIGLQNLMQMRQQAKMGLKEMEDMGQMGNSEEATMPDDMPFDINDIDMEDEEEYNSNTEMARGGVVRNFAEGGDNTAPAGLNMTERAYTAPPRTVAAPKGGYTYKGGAQPETTTSYDNLLGSAGANEYRTYVNDAGDEIQVPFLNGSMLIGYVLPDGYRPKTVDEIATPKIQTARAKSTRPTQQDAGDGDGDGGDSTVADLGGARTTIGGVEYAVQYNWDGTVGLQSVENYKNTGKTNFQTTTTAMGDMIKTQAVGQIAQIAQVVGLKGLAVSAIAEKFGVNMPGKSYIDKMKAAVAKGVDITEVLKTSKEREIFGRNVGYDKEAQGTDSITGKQQSSIQKGLSSGVDTSKQTDISEKAMQDRANKQAAEQRAAEQRAADARDAQRAAAEAESREENRNNKSDNYGGNASNNDSDPGGGYGDSSGSMGGMGDFNIGGLAGKKKPKVKMMKRGGLASRK